MGKEPFTTELDELIAIRALLAGGISTDISPITDVLGGLTDVAVQTPDNVSTVIAYLKGILTGLTATRAGYLDELGAANIPADIDTLLTRLSATRAGYLDNLSAGAVAQAATALSTATWTAARAGYLDALNRQTPFLDFWSASQEEVALSDTSGPAGTDVSLPSVTVSGLPAGCTILRVVAMFKFRAIENTNVAANKLNGAQDIQVRDDTPGAWADCINFVDDQFSLAASTREGGDVFFGSIDIKATVDGDDTYEFQWDESLVDQANLNFNDVQMGLRIWFR